MDYFRAKRYLDARPDWEVGRPAPGPLADYLPRMRALLARLGDPQTRFRSVIVGGTNGKRITAYRENAILIATCLETNNRPMTTAELRKNDTGPKTTMIM